MKYIKKFANSADYQQFIGGGDYVTPNLCLMEDSYDVVLEPEAAEVKIIKFYVPYNPLSNEYIEYTAIEGMTWGEYVNSSYNVDGFYFSFSLHSPNGVMRVKGGALVKENELIIENYYYILEP
jgi:hypothetical protein